MLLLIVEAVEDGGALVSEISAAEVLVGTRGQLWQLQEASIVIDIEALNTVKGHALTRKALNPDESFSWCHCEKHAWGDLVCTSDYFQEHEALEWESVLRHLVGINWRAVNVESAEVDLSLRWARQRAVIVVPYL